MKRKDIIVGAKYGHKTFPNTIYLGVGKYIDDDTYIKKTLVVIGDKTGQVGNIVKGPKNPDCKRGFWDDFYLIDD